jgi:hypothetical protein
MRAFGRRRRLVVARALGLHLSELPSFLGRAAIEERGMVKCDRSTKIAQIQAAGESLKRSPDTEGLQLQHASSEWPSVDASKV